MEITEVRVKLMEDSDDRLQGFCSVTFDNCFVVRDLKIIEGTNGPFVAMPSRKLTSHCHSCGSKNHLKAGYCNQCGSRLREDRTQRDQDGRAKLYADIAHPINSQCREMIQNRVITEYRAEVDRAQQPGYVSRYDDDYDDDIDTGTLTQLHEGHASHATGPHSEAPPPVSPATPPPMPPGSHLEGPASQPPAPHIPTAPPAEQRQREPDQHANQPPKKNGGNFGAGVFE
jgi:stage V sporulation protein G